MSPDALRIGDAYYFVTYAKRNLTIPGVEPWIYVGANISDEDQPTEPRYYFQDTISYFWRGDVRDPQFADTHPEIQYRLVGYSPVEVAEARTLEEAIECLQAAAARQHR